MANFSDLRPTSGATGGYFKIYNLGGSSVWAFPSTTGDYTTINQDVTSSPNPGVDKGNGIDLGDNAQATTNYGFTNFPTDVDSVTAITVRFSTAEANNPNGTLYSNDTGFISCEITDAAQTTVYADDGAGGKVVLSQYNGSTWTTALGYNRTEAFTLTTAGSNASKADWDAAQLRITYNDTAVMGSDGAAIVLVDVELEGTYTPTATTPSVDGADSSHAHTAEAGQISVISEWSQTESVTPTSGLDETFTETLGSTDTVTFAQEHSITVTESLGISDTPVEVQDHDYSVVDDSGLLDTAISVLDLDVAVTDALGGLDPPEAETTQVEVESQGLADSTAQEGTVELTDGLGGLDSAVVEVAVEGTDYTETPIESLGSTDTDEIDLVFDWSPAHIYVVPEESLGATDTEVVEEVTALTETVTEPLGALDSLAAEDSAETTEPLGSTDVLASSDDTVVPDTLGSTDTVEISLALGVTVVEPLGATDLDVEDLSADEHTQVDPLGATDTVTVSTAHDITVVDGVGLVDDGLNTIASDDFNRADEDLDVSADWENGRNNGFKIVSNVVSSKTWGSSVRTGTFDNDQWAEADVTLGTVEIGLVLRASDANNFTGAIWIPGGAGTYRVYSVNGGTFDQLGGDVTGVGIGARKLRLEAVGTQITLYEDGASIGTVTDSNNTAGTPGIWADDTDSTADNFAAGDFSPSVVLAVGGAALSETVTDDLGATDTAEAVNAQTLTTTEALGATDTADVSLEHTLVVTEALGLTEALEADQAQVLTDGLGGLDSSVVTDAGVFTEIVTDDLGAVDSIESAQDFVLVITEALGLLDTDTEAGGHDLTLTDNLGSTDTADVLEANAYSETITDGLGGLDSIVLATDLGLAFVDGLGSTDVDTEDLSGDEHTQVDPLGIIDTVEVAQTIDLVFTDSLGAIDSAVVTDAGVLTELVVEPLGSTDSVEFISTHELTFVDGLGLLEVTTEDLSGDEHAAVDPLGSIDSVEVSQALAVTIVESIGVTDTPESASDSAITDGLGAVDSIEFVKDLGVIPIESLGLTEALVNEEAYVLTDDLGSVDPVSFTESTGLDQTLNDLQGITDTVVVELVKVYDIVVTDGLGSTDTATPAVGIVITPLDALGTTDTSATGSALAVLRVEAIAGEDAVASVLDTVETIIETLGITDSSVVGEANNYSESFPEALGVTDSVEFLLTTLVVFTEAFGSTDTVEIVQVSSSEFTETIGITDPVSVIEAEAESLTATDPASLTDTAVLTLQFLQTDVDTVGMSDTVVVELSGPIETTDPVGMSDSVELAHDYGIEVTDAIGLLEELIAYLPTGTGFFYMDDLALLYVGAIPVSFLYYGNQIIWSAPA